MRFATILFAALLPAASPAAAEFYLGARGGASLLQDSDNEGGGVSIESEFDTGFLIGGTAGYAFPTGLRTELELTYRQNDADTLTITNDGGAGVALGVG